MPITVIVARGLGEGDAERLAGQVEAEQLSTGSFRPLFVIDTADFAPFRQRGYVVERVMRREELAAVKPDDDHDEYVQARLDMLVRLYGASSVVWVGPDDLDGVREAIAGERAVAAV